MAIKFTTINGGTKVWMARVAYKGRRIAKVCKSKAEARDEEAKLLQKLKAEALETEQAGERPATIKALFELYVTDLDNRGKSAATVGRAVETAKAVESVMPALLTMPVGRVRDRDIYEFRQARTRHSARASQLREQAQKLRASGKPGVAALAETKEREAIAEDRKGTKPSTVNRDLRTLRAMLKQARPEFRFPGGAIYPEDETRVRWLRPEEELLVLETMASPFREIAKLAALTLMRQGEIRYLRRESVHLQQGVVMLPRAKAGARPVVLSAEAQKILKGRLEAHESEWAFPGPDGRPYSRVHVSRVFRKASRAAGLKDFHFHDLRHHGATMALNKGFTSPIVQALGGWKSEKMMKRYAAVTDTTLRAAAEAVSGNEPWQYAANRASTQAVCVPSQG